MTFRRFVGNCISGASIGAGVGLATGAAVSWRGMFATVIIVMGTVIGDAIRSPVSPSREGE